MVINDRLGRRDGLRDFNGCRTRILLLALFLDLSLPRSTRYKSHLAGRFDEEPADTLFESPKGWLLGWSFLEHPWLDHPRIKYFGDLW